MFPRTCLDGTLLNEAAPVKEETYRLPRKGRGGRFDGVMYYGTVTSATSRIQEDSTEDQTVGLTMTTLQRMLTQDKPDELIALYTFYAKTTKHQNTQRIWCKTAFVAKGLKWKPDKVRRVKKRLHALGLIEDYVHRDEKGKVKGWYILVRYVSGLSTLPQNPEGGDRPSNALEYKEKCLREKYQSLSDWSSFSEEEKRIVSFYNGFLPNEDPSFLPVDRMTDKLSEAIQTFSDSSDDEIIAMLEDAYRTRKSHKHRTLVSILWSNY